MVSEMVTNVLVHTDGDALLVAEVTGAPGDRRLRIEVADASDDLPHKRRPGEMASSGPRPAAHGVLADTWGVDPQRRGQVHLVRALRGQRHRWVGAAGPVPAQWPYGESAGMVPRRPAWKSSNAWVSSSWVFITNGP